MLCEKSHYPLEIVYYGEDCSVCLGLKVRKLKETIKECRVFSYYGEHGGDFQQCNFCYAEQADNNQEFIHKKDCSYEQALNDTIE